MGDGQSPEDILEQGSDREPRFTFPRWRLSRAAGILAVLTLVAGLGVGYSVGRQQGGHNAAATIVATTPTASSTASPTASPTVQFPINEVIAVPGSDARMLTQEPGTCSAQVGQDYELGIQVTNTSQQPVVLQTVKPVPGVPGMISVLSWQWNPCGYNAAGSALAMSGTTRVWLMLQPGESVWLTATVKPLVACPTRAPLQFNVTYTVNSQTSTPTLAGFSDLSTVPFAGCKA